MTETKIAAIIPARMGSSRYPGKPLLEIEGLPMIEHVRRRLQLSKKIHDVIVTTKNKRIEIRGFGSFSLHYRNPRIGRNPKTGAKVAINESYVPHFKPGKNLKKQVNEGTEKFI